MEITNFVRNVKSVCDGMHESMNAYKTQTDAGVNSLRSEMNKSTEQVNYKVGDINQVSCI
jgi:uncharacterized protein YoxC